MNQKKTIGRWILAIAVGAILCTFMSIIAALALVKPALALFNLTSSHAFPTVIVYIESGLETLLGCTLGGLAAVRINRNRRPFLTACLASLLGFLLVLSGGIELPREPFLRFLGSGIFASTLAGALIGGVLSGYIGSVIAGKRT